MKHLLTAAACIALLGACAQARSPAPDPAAVPPAMADAEPEVTRQVQALLDQLASKGSAVVSLTENARLTLSPAVLAAFGAAWRDCGGARELVLLQRQTKGEARMYTYRAPCGGKPLLVEIDFGKGERVSRLELRPQ